MNHKILILQNVSREGPGLLEFILKEKKIPYVLFDLNQEAPCPPLSNFKAMVVLGGPDSANDSTPKMEKERACVQEAIRLGLPYLGICLGLQVLVKAAGAKVVQNPVKEVGFRDPKGRIFSVQLTTDGLKDPLLLGLKDSLEIFQLHGETVESCEGMTLLGQGEFCKNQILKVSEKMYGIQGHFELTPEMFHTWIHEDPDLILLNRKYLENDFRNLEKAYTQTGKTLFQNFLKIAGF